MPIFIYDVTYHDGHKLVHTAEADTEKEAWSKAMDACYMHPAPSIKLSPNSPNQKAASDAH